MGISSDSPSDDPKHDIVMGYPSMHDKYHHQAHQMYPSSAASSYPAPCHSQEYTSSSLQQYHHGYASSPFQHPHGYASSSFQPHHHAYDTSPFQHDGNYLSSTPYPQPYNDYYYQQPYKPESGNTASFGRVMLILMIVLVASMCMMSLVMWFLFGTYIPEFEVVSIKVSNFTATNTTLTGIWYVEMSVSNTNKELDVNFDHGMSSIFYKDALLGISTLQPFDVEKMQRFDVNYSMPAEQRIDDHKLQNWVLPTLAQDRSNGVVVFGLRLAMEANFTAPNIVYRQESLRVLCENMEISFSPNGEGILSPGVRNTCLIRLHEGLD